MGDFSETNLTYSRAISLFARELEQFPEKSDEIITRYSNLALVLEDEDRAVGAKGFMWDCIDSLYGKDEEHVKMADRARLALGATVAREELTDKERLAVASILIEVFKKNYGDPF